MFDNLFTGVLTLGLMASGAFAFGSELAAGPARPAAVAAQVVTLPAVTVVAHRHTAAALHLASL